MGTPCTPAPSNKREYIFDLGRILVKEHGKKKFYSPEEVKKAHEKRKSYQNLDFSCWAMSTFSSHAEFDKYHERTGEVCDYVEMKTEMLSGLSFTATGSGIPDSDIDSSWLEFGNIIEGIGEFIGGIFTDI